MTFSQGHGERIKGPARPLVSNTPTTTLVMRVLKFETTHLMHIELSQCPSHAILVPKIILLKKHPKMAIFDFLEAFGGP